MNQKKRNLKKHEGENNRLMLMIVGGAALLLLIIFVAPKLLKGSFKEASVNNSGYVELNAAEIGTKATFFSYDYKGTKMEFFAVKDSNGAVRLAFNRCQVCYDSGRGYFKQSGSEFVCQNCGNRYQTNQIGTEKGGCNPSPITYSDKIVNGNKVEIKESIFSENRYLFR